MGGGIGSMHYIGMMAMQMDAVMAYDLWLFSASIVVAVVLAGVSLKVHATIANREVNVVQQLIPAIIMGSAIAGMHYTGMLSMHVYPLPSTVFIDNQDAKSLGYLVAFMVVFFALILILLIELRARTLSADRFTAVLNTVQEGVFTFDSDGRLEFVNPAALTMFGYQEHELKFRRVSDLVSQNNSGNHVLLNEVIKSVEGRDLGNIPHRIDGVRKNGSTFPLSFLVNKLPGNHEAFVCTVKDLSDVKNQEVFTQTVFDTLPDMLIVKDANTLAFTHVNNMVAQHLKMTKSDLVGLTDFDVFELDEAKRIVASDTKLIESEQTQSCEEERFVINGKAHYFQIKKVIIKDGNNRAQYLLSLSEDITELRKTEQELQALHKRMSMAADAAHIGVWEWDLTTNELIWDDWMHRIYSIPKEEFDEHYSVWASTVHVDDFESLKAHIDHTISTKSDFHTQFRVQVGKNKFRYIRADGRLENNKMFGINMDITEQIEAERRITELATHDSLTGLSNRYALATFVKKEFARVERSNKRCLCLYLDLNKFKPINDTYGHNVGDEVLVEIAKRLSSICRLSDMAARVGGDEFVIIVSDIDEKYDIASIIQRTHNEIIRAVITSKGEMFVDASIGFAIYPTEAKTFDDLIRVADERMFNNKTSSTS
jgi:diguanylate cyclase (GGDEF)-like protein/PAS domain S-box-containing protein